ncbi:MAG: signal peptide peptidase SppA [Bdellovibrionales bacterium]|nr:signal peptide peptidase SppA [Bdellovibrionales bacterium]
MDTLKKVLQVLVWGFFGLIGLGMVMGIFGIVMLLTGNMDQEDFADVKTDRAVGVVDISGEIVSSDEFYRELKRHVDSDKIKGIVVRIDSPGGAVGASEEIYRFLKNAQKSKPIVCAMGSIAASGGFLASLGCQKTYANPGTLTGSIGVILAVPNFAKIMERFEVKMNVIKSGKLKDAGSPFREMTADDRSFLQSVIDVAYNDFLNLVATSRGLETEKVREFADGRIISGSQAIELGIVDEAGGLEEAAATVLEIAGIQGEPEIILPEKKSGVRAFLDGVNHLVLGLADRTTGSAPVLMYRLAP